MFDTKLEVDRHVESCLKKINNETERNLRCFAFARLYFKVGDYEQARKYVSAYLTVKPLSAEGLKLLGETLEKQGKQEGAIDAYRKSLDIDPKQNSLVLKVCELLASDNVSLDQAGARYFCEKAQIFDPHNPVVFNLKERLVAVESQDPADVSQLLLTELATRPTDIHLRVRLLRHLLQNNQIKEAYKHASDIEQKNLPIFLNSLSWYETIAEVLVRYQRDNMSNASLSWEFWMLLVSVLDKLVALTLHERSNNIKSGPECLSVVFNLDQTLSAAAANLTNCNERPLVQEFLNHYRAQLCFHLVTLLFKQAKRDLFKYKDAMQMALPLLFSAYHTQPAELHCMWLDHSPDVRRQQIQRWHREAAFRCSQAGHILLAASKDRKVTIVEKAMQGCSGLWREQLFKKLFVTRDQQAKIKSSYFVSCPCLVDINVRLPDMNDLIKYDEVAQLVHSDSLHHLVWICLNHPKLSTFRCTVFDGLQYSVKNLNNCAAESLSVLDVEAFLYCTTLTVQMQLEEMKHQVYYNSDKPNVLPVAVTDQLESLNQTKWLTAAYKMYKNDYDCNMSEFRLNLIRGIEVVRCVGNHGLDVKLLVILANGFADRAKTLSKQSEIEFNEARAELYWKAALPLLEKMQKNQAVTYSAHRLFDYKSKEMSPGEIVSFLDEGKLFSANQLMKKKEHEKALHIFESLRSPYASFHQAQIYKTMADEQINQNKENVTSEMRSQHIILLSRARDCLYLTLDRLRDPSIDRKHPLNTQLGTEIEKVERLLSRIDPDVYNHRNECDGMSDENVSSAGSMGDHLNNVYSSTLGNSFYPHESLTPQYDRNNLSNRYRFELPTRREARPSPERLDAQLRQMQASRDTTITHIMEQNRIMVDSHRSLVDELRTFRDAVTNLTSTVDELKTVKRSVNEELQGIKESVDSLKVAVDDLQNFRDVTDMVQEMKKEIADLKKDSSKPKNSQLSEEDLYVLDEEYGGDYGLNSNVAGFNPANLYQNYQARLPSAGSLPYPAPALYPGLYPMYPYTSLGLAQAGALPFGQEAQISDFRALSSLSQGLPQANYGQPNLTQSALAQPKSAWDVGMLGLMPPVPAPVQPGLTISQPQTSTVSSTASANLPPPNIFSSVVTQGVSITSYPPPTSAALSKVPPPINVVITSSDPLPKTSVQTTQVLSVTIPPQHLKSNQTPKVQPHNYQIPLPINSVPSFSCTPAIINQPSLVVATQGLLSNISPPVYSAVEPKSPGRGTGLGLKIEKSLSHSFNASDGKSHNKSGHEEHDPCPDFKPIIPLPDEVPVNTGEENELVLFSERAKLFRFTNKEWRERGVGTMKILEDKGTGKVRILMRRDQVHKICANHLLTKDLVLTPMPNNSRAYVWAAHDFSNEEMVVEKLCVRFKTEGEAYAFYMAIEQAKLTLSDSISESQSSDIAQAGATSHSTPIPSPAKNSEAVASLGGFIFTSTPSFKPKEQTATTNVTVQQPEPQKSSPFASFTFGVKTPGVAATTTTTIFNSPTSSIEFKPLQMPAAGPTDLSTPKKSVAAAASATSPKTPDDFEPSIDFKPVVPLPELVDVKTGEENAEILFESRAKLLRYVPTSKEWKERGVGIMKLLKENTIRLVMRREQVHKVCCNHQLLKGMQFIKMANNSKALTWYAQDFSEGVLKTEMFAIRFKSEEQADAFFKAIVSAQDLLDENSVVKSDKKVAIPEIKSDSTKDTKTKSKEDKKVKSDPSEKPKVEIPKASGWGDKFKPKLGSWECKNCYIVNDVRSHLCLACETPRSSTTPKKSADAESATTQFSFGVTPTSTASAAVPSNVDAAKLQFSFGTPSTNTVTTSTEFLFGQKSPSIFTTSWGDAFKPKVGTWECQQCLVRNDADKQYCVSCEHPKDDSVPKKEANKGVSLETPANLNFSFGMPVGASKAPAPSLFEAFKPKAGSWECAQCYVVNDPNRLCCSACENSREKPENAGLQFNFGMPSNTTTKTSSTTPFGFIPQPTSTFTFGTGAVTVSPADSTTTKPFAFALGKEEEHESKEDHESFVFGSPQKHTFEFTPRSPRRHSSGCQGDDEPEAFVEDEGEHIYFKPVIPLPDKVDVKTGEEQEEVLYCHRAKLFRFVQGEWKERGIGDIKILLRGDTGKLRVLMRREQVLKICLNHTLTTDFEYILKDDKTWLFTAPDYSEGEINLWQFCLRFKTADIAQDFRKAVDKALKSLGDGDASTAGISKEDDSDVVEFVSETQVTPEEEQEAIRLKLPPKFMSYRQLPDCTCDTCKQDDVLLSQLFHPQPLCLFGSTTVTPIFGTPCKPSYFSSPNPDNKFLFGTPFKPTASTGEPTTPTNLNKSESLKEMLMKPSVLSNIATSKNDKGTLGSTALFSNLAATTTPVPTTTGSTIKNFSFSFKGDTPTASSTTSNLFSQIQTPKSTASIFGGAATVGSIFSGTTAPSGSLFDTAKTSTTGSSLFGSFAPASSGGSIFGSTAVTTASTTMVSTGNLFGTPTTGSLFGGPTNSIFGGSVTPTTNATSKLFGAATSTSIFNTSGVDTKTSVAGGDNKDLFGNATPLFGAIGDTASASVASVTAPKSEPVAKQVELQKEEELVLKCDSSLSFASLAAGTSSAETFAKAAEGDSTKPFAFLGSGAPVFASLKKPSKAPTKDKDTTQSGDEAECVETDAAEEYDPHYEPIVPLPDTIVVSTGEEDEQVIFNERAKVFRFDNQNKEWKERGVGQLKILHHPVNGTYRFLLRRELVHKVVLNMRITPNIDLQPMSTSDKAWLWCGYNHSEDDASLEKLAARFKNCDLAHQFRDAVQLAVAAAKEQQNKSIPSTIQNYGVQDVSDEPDTSQGVVDEAGDDDDDDDEDEEDDDRTVMYIQHCGLSEQLPTGEWKDLGPGELQLYYDPEIYGSRISIIDDTGCLLSNTLIGINTEMACQDNSCVWKAVEWTEMSPRWRTLQATFANEKFAEEFHCSYLESVQFAHESDLVDGILAENRDIEDED